jgi:uncharacterized PurR-regulated membrane protein YhhQ (DUF165 family)
MAVVAANLAVDQFGQQALPFTAFLLIPFDLVVRDLLHERWKGNRLRARMGSLILAGSLSTIVFNQGASRVALASFCAFLTAGVIDTIIYHALEGRSRLLKINGSNLFSSITDSAVFPFIAFGSASLWLCAAQAGSKFLGGFVWSLLIYGNHKTVSNSGRS